MCQVGDRVLAEPRYLAAACRGGGESPRPARGKWTCGAVECSRAAAQQSDSRLPVRSQHASGTSECPLLRCWHRGYLLPLGDPSRHGDETSHLLGLSPARLSSNNASQSLHKARPPYLQTASAALFARVSASPRLSLGGALLMLSRSRSLDRLPPPEPPLPSRLARLLWLPKHGRRGWGGFRSWTSGTPCDPCDRCFTLAPLVPRDVLSPVPGSPTSLTPPSAPSSMGRCYPGRPCLPLAIARQSSPTTMPPHDPCPSSPSSQAKQSRAHHMSLLSTDTVRSVSRIRLSSYRRSELDRAEL